MNQRHYVRSCVTRLYSLIVVALLAFAPSQLIAAPPVDDLLNQKLRPTIDELKKHDLSGLPANSLTEVFNGLNEHAAEFIAALDRLYPNANYSTMGRDSVLHADVLEAFYLSIGQNDRVKRFNVSGASFTAGAPMVEYLEQLGLNLDPNDKAPRPFVLIDTATSTTGARQPRNALNMAYQVFQKRGGAGRILLGARLLLVSQPIRGADIIKISRELKKS